MPSAITVCAHRGASGTHPENTVSAMRHAAELGCEMVRARMPSSYFSTALLAADPGETERRLFCRAGRVRRTHDSRQGMRDIARRYSGQNNERIGEYLGFDLGGGQSAGSAGDGAEPREEPSSQSRQQLSEPYPHWRKDPHIY